VCGQGIWKGLDSSIRETQARHMTHLLDELYPEVRLFLFDGKTLYSAPYTVFGPNRAVVFLGQIYFVFNTTEHIRALARHFDDLIRNTSVHAHEVTKYIRDLRHSCLQ